MTKRQWDPRTSIVERRPDELVVSCDQPGIMAVPHWHAQAEVNYVVRGAVEYDMGGRRLRLGAGELALFWGGLPHQVVDTSEDSSYHAIHLPLAQFFRLRLAPGLPARLMRGATLVATEPQADDAPAFARRAPWLCSGDPRRVAHALDELLLRLERIALEPHRVLDPEGEPAAGVATAGPDGGTGVRRLCAFVAQNFRDDIAAADIARAADIHPKYAMSLFRRATGMTLGTYVSLLRVSYAQARLLDEEASILQVAMDAGFGSVSAFNKCFRAKAGLTPSEFRRGRRAARPAPLSAAGLAA